MRSTIFSAVAAVALTATASAQATPILYAMVFDNGVQVGGTVSASNGLLNFSGSDANFSSVTLTVDGVGVIPSPDLASQTTRVDTATGFTGTHTLAIAITQVGVTAPLGAMSFANTFTSNFLINGSGVTTDSIQNYFDASNNGFAETSLLASFSCSSGTPGTCSSPIYNTLEQITGPFSETQIFSATFTAGGAALQSSAQIVGTTVPEPASVAMFGMGLLGLGLVQRRNKRS